MKKLGACSEFFSMLPGPFIFPSLEIGFQRSIRHPGPPCRFMTTHLPGCLAGDPAGNPFNPALIQTGKQMVREIQ